jgi:hypothetical protein
VEQLGAGSRAERVQVLLQPELEFVGSHLVLRGEAQGSSSGPLRTWPVESIVSNVSIGSNVTTWGNRSVFLCEIDHGACLIEVAPAIATTRMSRAALIGRPRRPQVSDHAKLDPGIINTTWSRNPTSIGATSLGIVLNRKASCVMRTPSRWPR